MIFITTNEDIFNFFFDAFRNNIDAIIEVYFRKLSFYYILDEYKEFTFKYKLITNCYRIGLLTDPDELRLHSKSIKFTAKSDHLETIETFLRRTNPKINFVDDHKIICKAWAELTCSFIIDILTKIFGAKLADNIHCLQFTGDNILSFDFTSTEDIIQNRSKYAKGSHHFRNGVVAKEIYKTISIVKNEVSLSRAMRSVLKIKYNENTHKLITLKFYNLRGSIKQPFKDILERFEIMYPKLLDNYYEKLLGGYIVFINHHKYL